ncbi:MAG TPA: hypothetical protein VM686_05990 [Polyangiaceae bacterium]|nr:hypothetical protein [Polyangiaceae bacterium]
MVERTGTFAVAPVKRRQLNEKPAQNRRIGELIAEELRTARPGSAFARYGRPSWLPRVRQLKT